MCVRILVVSRIISCKASSSVAGVELFRFVSVSTNGLILFLEYMNPSGREGARDVAAYYAARYVVVARPDHMYVELCYGKLGRDFQVTVIQHFDV